jgi:hypothetical protein
MALACITTLSRLIILNLSLEVNTNVRCAVVPDDAGGRYILIPNGFVTDRRISFDVLSSETTPSLLLFNAGKLALEPLGKTTHAPACLGLDIIPKRRFLHFQHSQPN